MTTATTVTSAIDHYLGNIYSPAVAHIRAVVVTVNGTQVAARYRAANPTQTYDVHSVTKSVVGALVGIALHEGKLHSLDDTLSAMLPDRAAQMSPTVRRVTLRQLLTMTSGLPADPAGPDGPKWMSAHDWVGTILATGVTAPPGSSFAYGSAGSHLLAAVLTRATGMSVLDYARPRLFNPLGIDTRHAAEPRFSDKDADARYESAGFAWPRDPTGIQSGFAALKMSAGDMEKLGRLYLQNGRWDSKQLVPAAWVQQSTTTHIPTNAPSAVAEAYGYQWWVTTEKQHRAFLAAGFGGQLIEVVPDARLVVVVATAADTDSNPRWAHLRGMVADAILPAVGG